MSKVVNNLRVLKMATHHSMREFFATYPFKVYLIAWLPRIVAQIAFFALLARFVGGVGFLYYALIGNAVYLLASTAITFVTASVTWERRAGTLPLLIASPSSPLIVLSGRNIGMGLHAYLTGVIGLLLIGPLLGLSVAPLSVVLVLLLLLVISISTYGLGLILGAIALRTRGLHNVLSNLLTLTMLSVCGVNVPLSQLPDWVQIIGQLLPLTHGLQSIRLVLDSGGLTGDALVNALLELALGVIYISGALVLFHAMLKRSRQAGTLELT